LKTKTQRGRKVAAQDNARPAHQFQPGNTIGKRWQAGQSGNPSGRPSTHDMKAAVREFADEFDTKIGKSRFRQWLEQADRRARQGSSKHLELLLAYGWGRPLQQQINLNADLTQEQRIMAMSDDEKMSRIAELLETHRESKGRVQ